MSDADTEGTRTGTGFGAATGPLSPPNLHEDDRAADGEKQRDGFDARGGDRAATVAAVKLTTEELPRRGYRFVTIDELLAVPAYQEDR